MLDTFLSLPTVVLVIIYVFLSLLFLLGVLLVIRAFLRNNIKKPDALQMQVLRICLPKEGQEDDAQNAQPPGQDQIKEKISVAEIFFSTLGGMKAQRGFRAFIFGRNDHFSLEIVADKDGLVTFYAAVPRFLKLYFEQQVQAQYESAEIVEVDDYNIFEAQGEIVGAKFSLEKNQMYPIQTYDKMESDPLNALTNILSKFEKKEGAAIQYVIRSAKAKWHKDPMRVARTMQQGKNIDQAYNEVMSNIVIKIFRAIFHAFSTRKSKYDAGIDPNT